VGGRATKGGVAKLEVGVDCLFEPVPEGREVAAVGGGHVEGMEGGGAKKEEGEEKRKNKQERGGNSGNGDGAGSFYPFSLFLLAHVR